MLAIEHLHEQLLSLNKVCREKALENAIQEVMGAENPSLAADMLLGLIEDAKSEVEVCQFRREEKLTRYLNILSEVRGALFSTLMKRERNSLAPLFKEDLLERVSAVSDSVSENLEGNGGELNRPDFLSATQSLIEEVDKWAIGQYEKRALILSLKMVVQQASSTGYSASDQEIRRRVKSVVASFCVEFCGLDNEFETWFETLKRWARLGYEGAPSPLGITSKAAKVAGLLPSP